MKKGKFAGEEEAGTRCWISAPYFCDFCFMFYDIIVVYINGGVKMKIKLLGTAAFEGIPALFCRCDICQESRKLGGKNIRMRSSALVDNKIGLDFTNDTLAHIHNYNLDFSVLEHLFIGHSHSDHFNYYDLEAKLKWYTNEGNPVLNVYANKVSIEMLSSYLEKFGDISPYMKLHVLEPFTQTKVEDYTVTALPATHITDFPEEKALVYVIERNGKRIFYGLDSGWYYDETWEYLKTIHLDCMVLDCTNGFAEGGTSNHMSFEENVNVVKKLTEAGSLNASSKIVSTHFSHNGKVVYDRHCEEFAGQGIIMSYDGIEIEV